MKVLTVRLLSCRSLHAAIKNSHNFPGVRHVCPLFISSQQVFSDVGQVVLEDLAPVIALAKLLKVFRGERGKVKCLVTSVIFHTFHQSRLFGLISSWDSLQICSEVLVGAKKQIRELLEAKVRISVDLRGH